MDAGVVPEDSKLLMFASSQPQLHEEGGDVFPSEGSSVLVHLQQAAAPLTDSSEDGNILLASELVRELQGLPLV